MERYEMMPAICWLVLLSRHSVIAQHVEEQGLQLRSARSHVHDSAQLAHRGGWRRSRKRSLLAEAEQHDYYSQLVMSSAKLANQLKKVAVLNSTKYDRTRFSREPFDEWLRDTTLALTPRLSTPPISFRCGVFYHPGYQIIFIRNRKAASSTFMTVINEALKQEHAGLLTRMRPEKLHAEGKDVDAMWREYTVVSTIRNPWARAASGYDYTHRLWTQHDKGCGKPSFLQFSRDPMIMGRLSNMMGCAVNRTITRHSGDAWEHDFYHIEPAFHCLFEDGKPVVDYLVRYEHLHEDIAEALAVINERKPSDKKALSNAGKLLPWAKRGTTFAMHRERLAQGAAIQDGAGEEGTGVEQAEQKGQGRATLSEGSKDASKQETSGNGSSGEEGSVLEHGAKYKACGKECVDNIATFFSNDLKLLGFSVPAA